ncbi:dolichyl-phosphate-mannose-protein mannosyltransferase [Tautonia sociabilis]|uniref:Dolichyl-phosphate-mannose-protein mannosyltransferase n=1 Tax=Tautonia sociabilis TaxID=2080755 RepID=A0A432MCA3_9BACT|nr:dolichyl-phosphate-mannose-protein mannosyltransferase [Tautonia sociabilis]RUL81745.1 dolichyl-phosphate-mannose-protein mannosyltransferase [Tautonia sociabilis]
MIEAGGRRFRAIALAVVVLGLAGRAAVMTPLLRSPPGDPDNYLMLASSLAEGRGLRSFGRPTAYRPPLYPIALAPGVLLFGPTPTPWVVALNLAAGGAAIALTGLAARRWGLPGRSTLLAMLVVALDPVLVSQARGVMTESLASALVAGMLAACSPRPSLRSSAALGTVGGLAALCRPSLLPAAGLIALALLLRGPGRWPDRLGRSSVMLAALAATLSPWAIRNAFAVGAPVWTTTHGGYTLYLANNHAYYDDVLDGDLPVWTGANQRRWFAEVTRLGEGKSEPESDRLFRERALRVMRSRPGDFARATLGRLGRFWAIAPSSAVYPGPLRLATAAWTAPLWVLLGAGLLRPWSRRWPAIAAVAVALALTIVHSLYWTDLRMRAPAVPAIALVAAGAVSGRPAGRSHTPGLGS